MPIHLERAVFQQLENDINAILQSECDRLMSDAQQVASFSLLFDRSTETGFYAGSTGPRGQGEQPTWSPNPAYMDSLEKLWIPVDDRLRRDGLGLEKTLRELFYSSHEYKDRQADHRRVFHGHLMHVERELPVSYFMLSIPHSHKEFRYVTPPQIQISPSL